MSEWHSQSIGVKTGVVIAVSGSICFLGAVVALLIIPGHDWPLWRSLGILLLVGGGTTILGMIIGNVSACIDLKRLKRNRRSSTRTTRRSSPI